MAMKGQDTRKAFPAALLLAALVLSSPAGNDASPHAITGTVIAVESREWIAVVNETTDPLGVRITLRPETTYDAPAAIMPGVRVTMRYRSVGERRHIADSVRVLSERAALTPVNDDRGPADPAGTR
jgi:hypothetical protein